MDRPITVPVMLALSRDMSLLPIERVCFTSASLYVLNKAKKKKKLCWKLNKSLWMSLNCFVKLWNWHTS